jgi:hypothetical protein
MINGLDGKPIDTATILAIWWWRLANTISPIFINPTFGPWRIKRFFNRATINRQIGFFVAPITIGLSLVIVAH